MGTCNFTLACRRSLGTGATPTMPSSSESLSLRATLGFSTGKTSWSRAAAALPPERHFTSRWSAFGSAVFSSLTRDGLPGTDLSAPFSSRSCAYLFISSQLLCQRENNCVIMRFLIHRFIDISIRQACISSRLFSKLFGFPPGGLRLSLRLAITH